MKAKRLFVCIELPTALKRLLASLNPKLRGVRWLDPELMHLTLVFLDRVSVEEEEKLKQNLTRFEWKPFFLPVTGLGKFPGKGSPKVVWVGVGRGHPHLFQLHKRVQEAALGAGLDPELRSFHPHITLARCHDVSEGSVLPFLKAHATFDAGMMQVESFSLFASALTPAGPVYTRELEIGPK